ncbi:MAG: Fic family protein [Candidatus Nanopelagicales bacterium]|nr:Fic family protein [Candidatus Nanopelagicales bacterium]
MARQYESTHPWLTFKLPELTTEWRTWQRFGEASSKSEHLAGVAINPRVAHSLAAIYLAKGAHASTAIEGNSLTESQVLALVEGGAGVVPPSLDYQETEVRNLLNVLREIDDAIVRGQRLPLNAQRICQLNLAILDGTDIGNDVVPGEVRAHSVTVGAGRYRGAPAEDCQYLLEALCHWLNGPDFNSDDPELRFALILTKAVMAHVYLAWIHPFGDGNGRTARAVESQILSQSGRVPQPATNLLSDHYNKTRDRYYQHLDSASRNSPSDTRPLLAYAVQGFVDGLGEQIAMIAREQIKVAWINYVYSTMDSEPNTATAHRRRKLVLALRPHKPTPTSAVRTLSGPMAIMFEGKGERSVIRDLRALERLGLVTHHGHSGWTSNQSAIEAFKPPVFSDGASEPRRSGRAT